jgi:hypothetical protein
MILQPVRIDEMTYNAFEDQAKSLLNLKLEKSRKPQ